MGKTLERSGAGASMDRKKLVTTKQMTLAGVMTAVTCILGPFVIPLPISPVPLSITNLVLYFSVYLLGTRLAAISYLVYLLLGLVGLPVFSGFSGGAGKLAGPTGGYLIGFIFMVLVSGYFVGRFADKPWLSALALALGTLITYAFGTAWLSRQLGITFAAGLGIGVLPYLPGDAAKIILAVIAGPKLKKRVMRAVGQ